MVIRRFIVQGPLLPRCRVAAWVTIVTLTCSAARALPIRAGDLAQMPAFALRMVSARSGAVIQTANVWVEASEWDGEAAIALRVRTPLGPDVTRESRTLLRTGATLRCLAEEHRTYTTANETLSQTTRRFRADALPFAGLVIPDDTYPMNEGLLYLLAGLPLDSDGNGSFYVLGLVETLKLDVWRHGTDEITVPAGRFSCDHLRMRPNVESLNLPLVLRPLAPLFLPEIEAWIDRNPPHLTVRVKGPFGPSVDRDVLLEVTEIGTPVRRDGARQAE